MAAAVVAVLVPVLGACADARNHPAEDVAVAFYRALGTGDGAGACDLLAPATRSELEQSAGKPCPAAIVQEHLPQVTDAVGVDVFGTAAQVRFGSDTAFLGEFRDGWRVVAVGCRPRDPRPFDCSVSGG